MAKFASRRRGFLRGSEFYISMKFCRFKNEIIKEIKSKIAAGSRSCCFIKHAFRSRIL
jgi:hypothetical protein